MSNSHHNTQMFALSEPPPAELELGGRAFRLRSVFKHDFWAATCLYESSDASCPAKVVVKFGRAQSFCGLPLAWYGRWLAGREEKIYALLEGIEGVPQWIDRVGRGGYAIQYIDAKPLDQLDKIPPGLFDRLRAIYDQIHSQGVAYCDANKLSNILVTSEGYPFLIDYQIAIRRRDNWPWPLSGIVARIVRYLSGKDLYHLYKHKRRLAANELTETEQALSCNRTGLHNIHRRLTKPYRNLCRRFLSRQYAKGALKSPTAELENHPQPEKDTWRKM